MRGKPDRRTKATRFIFVQFQVWYFAVNINIHRPRSSWVLLYAVTSFGRLSRKWLNMHADRHAAAAKVADQPVT
jgi:hypothetical protein